MLCAAEGRGPYVLRNIGSQTVLYVKALQTGLPERLVVPRDFREKLLRSFHDDTGHFGEAKVTAAIEHHFWWPHMRSEIQAYIKKCDVC
jgi:Integrase zinc binding domain